MIKVFTTNKNNKIELSKEELKQLLDEAYWEGYNANNHSWTYTTPYVSPFWYSNSDYNTSSASTITLNSSSSSDHT